MSFIEKISQKNKKQKKITSFNGFVPDKFDETLSIINILNKWFLINFAPKEHESIVFFIFLWRKKLSEIFRFLQKQFF